MNQRRSYAMDVNSARTHICSVLVTALFVAHSQPTAHGEGDAPLIEYTGDGSDLQSVIDDAPAGSTVVCHRTNQLELSAPITITRPLTLKGLNARARAHRRKAVRKRKAPGARSRSEDAGRS